MTRSGCSPRAQGLLGGRQGCRAAVPPGAGRPSCPLPARTFIPPVNESPVPAAGGGDPTPVTALGRTRPRGTAGTQGPHGDCFPLTPKTVPRGFPRLYKPKSQCTRHCLRPSRTALPQAPGIPGCLHPTPAPAPHAVPGGGHPPRPCAPEQCHQRAQPTPGSAVSWGRCTACNSNKIPVNKCFLVWANERQAAQVPPPLGDHAVWGRDPREGDPTTAAPQPQHHVPQRMPSTEVGTGHGARGHRHIGRASGSGSPPGPTRRRNVRDPRGEQNALSAPVPAPAYLQIKPIWGP